MKKLIAIILIAGVLMASAVFVFASDDPDPKIIKPVIIEKQ